MTFLIRRPAVTASAVLALALSACGGSSSPAPAQPGPAAAASAPGKPADASPKVPGAAPAAIVNGSVITEAEVKLASGGAPLGSAERLAALEELVKQELIAQKAGELGLALDGPDLAEVARAEAQVKSVRRRALGKVFDRQEIAAKATVTDEEAKAYFEANAPALKAEYHVFQLMLRDRAAAVAAKAELDKGVPFEEVAKQQFPELPKGVNTPWDLGWLSHFQLPNMLREHVAKLEKGKVSEPIPGVKGRLWLVKLVDRRENTAMTFETARPSLLNELKLRKLDGMRDGMILELRGKAKVEFPEPVREEPKAARLGSGSGDEGGASTKPIAPALPLPKPPGAK